MMLFSLLPRQTWLWIVFFAGLASAVRVHAQGNCECSNCPQFMQDNFTGSFLINVQNAANPTLGVNGQAVCGVNLNFDHEYIGDLQITLTAPSGQTVTLVGPIGFFGATDGSSWNISFLQCGDPAVSPDPGFSATWNNNQPWGLGGTYTGSYYPVSGCLQNFTGPVNGTWSLTVTDGQANDVGNFYDYEIIFCDPSGIDCFSCAAEAGNLLQPDVVACEGGSNLDLNLPPTYTPTAPEPPSALYSYTYVIGGPGGVILDYDPNADLSAYPPGTYTVCGLSYYTAQAAQLPPPNGSLTITQLRNQLNSTMASFCGDISVNCVNVTINQAPADIEETVEICAPDCYLFGGINRCQSGTYTITLTQSGCQYLSTLYLTVGQSKITNVVETICEGACSSNPLFPDACDQGVYSETLQTYLGCDSVVNLNLNVLSVGAVIVPPPALPCGGGSIQLQGAGSSAGAGVSYLWTASNGGNIVGPATLQNVNVNAPGDYQLRVCRQVGGNSCCDSTLVTVEPATDPPSAPALVSGPTALCQGQSAIYAIGSVSGATSYTWTTPSGVSITSGGNTPVTNLLWNSPNGGDVCVTANNGCGSSDPTCITVAVNSLPNATVPQGPAAVCVGDTATYSIPPVVNAATYNWVVPPAAQILGGQGTQTIQVLWLSAGSASICVNTNNTCGASPQQCLPVQVGLLPAAPSVNGLAALCAGVGATYAINTPVAGVTYNWSMTNGSIVSGNGTDSVQVVWNPGITSGSICVTAGNTCGQSAAACLNVTLSEPPPATTISGPVSFCVGDTGVYQLTPIAGAIGYTWVVSSNGTLISAQNNTFATVVWHTAGPGTVSVATTGTCGTAPTVAYNVTVHAYPTPDAGAPQNLCDTIATLNANGVNGVWSLLSGPGTATFNTANLPNAGLSVSQTGIYQLIWSENANGCVGSDTVAIAFNALPVIGPVAHSCDAANEFYTISFPISGGVAPFVVINDTIGVPNYTSGSIASGQPYSFVVQDANGCLSQTVQGSINCNCSTNAGAMSTALLQACAGSTVTAVQTSNPVLDANDIGIFVLHEGNGITLVNPVAQNAGGTFGFQSGMVFGQTYYISYVVGNNQNGAPALNDPCLSIAQGQPVVFYDFPVITAGPDAATCEVNLTLQASGAGSWTMLGGPAGGNPQWSALNLPTANFQADIPGVYTLQWTVSVNNCTSVDTVQITFYESPLVLNTVEDCDPANEFYTLTFEMSGGTAPYTVNGTALAGAQFTSALIPSGQTYQFAVTDANGCTAPDVSGVFACNCGTQAGTMNNTLLKACAADSVQAQVLQPAQLDGNDVIGFVLHTGSGASLGTLIAQNSSGLFGFVPGMVLGQTYYISQVVGNPNAGFPDPADPCFSVAPGQPVVFLEIPTANAGPDQTTCFTNLQLNANAGPFVGQWSAGTNGLSLIDPALANTGVSAAAPGSYTLYWTVQNDICSAVDSLLLTFFPVPSGTVVSELCNNTGTNYTVAMDLSGGTAPYTVAGWPGTVNGSMFTSELIPSTVSYAFTITDANGCTFGPINGVKNCNCLTDAGTMSLSPLVFCAGTPAAAQWNNDGNLDGDDMLQFVLHTGSGINLGQILAVADTPVFDYTPGIIIGQTYYISAVVGNNLNGNVDPSDPCLSIAQGTPVSWKALPTAGITGATTLCVGDGANLTFSGTGAFPLTVLWDNGTGVPQTLNIGGSGVVSVPVSPLQSTTYTLLQVEDGSLPACTVPLSAGVTITVNTILADAGQPATAPEICAETDSLVTLLNLLDNAGPGGVWTEVSGISSVGAAFDAASGTFQTLSQAPGWYQFRYTVTALAPCPSDSATVSVFVRPRPIADAGQDFTLDCNTTAVLLGGFTTSSGAGITYQWRLDGTPLSGATASSLEVSSGGVYALEVRNDLGCSASDAVVVTIDAEQPQVEAVQKKDISCFGRGDGALRVVGVTGGTPPYLYALNGGDFMGGSEFGPLGPGVYQIAVMDAKGCWSETDSILMVEPELLTAQLGSELYLELGDSAVVEAQINREDAALDTIIWSPVFDPSGVGTRFQRWLPGKTASIDIYVRDTNGCETINRLYIFVDTRRHVYVPNIFDPSGSEFNTLSLYGDNDVLKVQSFQIFDRWGNMVFEGKDFLANDETKGWDGRFGNQLVAPGVFVWKAVVLFKDGLLELFSGDVTVLR